MSVFKTSINQIKNTVLTMSEIPVVFLSYDEPNADENWENLKSIAPIESKIARVHGVLGFDAAHQAAGNCFTDADYVVTVDADNKVDPAFFNLKLPKTFGQDYSYTWAGRQFTNGLLYGNGGVKLWKRMHLVDMASHENSKDENSVDFCWDVHRYQELPGCYSTVYTNSSAYQAFRVGFREGIKLCLDQGELIPCNWISETMHAANYQRLLTWMTVGADVNFGQWSIYGARLAVKMLHFDDFNHANIRDYTWFNDFYKEQQNKDLITELATLSITLGEIFNFRLPNFTAEESNFIKRIQLHPEKPLTNEDVKWRTNLKLFGWFEL